MRPAGDFLLALTHGAPLDEMPERILTCFWCCRDWRCLVAPSVGWLLAKVVLAGIIGGTLVSEVGSKFSLTRACYGWLAAYLRRVLR